MTRSRVRGAAGPAAYLVGLMARRGYGSRQLAATVGYSPSLIYYWRTGQGLPTIDAAERIAVTLNDDRYLELVRRARTRRCARAACSATFAVEPNRGGKRIYCSRRCAERVNREGHLGRDPRQEAIDAMCAGCEPEGICRDGSCALRPYSPYLFVPIRRAVA